MIYIVIIILFVIILLLLCNRSCCGTCVQEPYDLSNKSSNKSSNKRVILFKTHIWSDSIEKFVNKIKSEIVNTNIDLYILMHTDDGSLINKVPAKLKSHVLLYSKNDIMKIYDKGFHNMWLSNHWILMWFYKITGAKYDYYWSIEYDVRITGDGNKLWSYDGTEDFIYPIVPFHDPTWAWKDYYTGSIFNDETKWYGYLQLARYSKSFLKWLDHFYSMGENGQDELITFSLFKLGQQDNNLKLTGDHHLLNNLIQKSWSVDSNDSDKHKIIQQTHEKDNQLVIIHPIK